MSYTTVFLILLLLLVPSVAFSQESIREYRRTNEHQLLAEYFQMLSIPNLASDTANIRRNADFLAERMRKAGLNPRLLEAADKKVPPVVYGEFSTPGAASTVIA